MAVTKVLGLHCTDFRLMGAEMDEDLPKFSLMKLPELTGCKFWVVTVGAGILPASDTIHNLIILAITTTICIASVSMTDKSTFVLNCNASP